MVEKACLAELTAVIVGCFVSRNHVTATELPSLIATTYETLAALRARLDSVQETRIPAVPIEESVTHDYLICLDDGKKLRSLRRYLRRKYLLSPEEYRERWHLPNDYPMVAPAYAELRSEIAKRSAHSAAAAPSKRCPP